MGADPGRSKNPPFSVCENNLNLPFGSAGEKYAYKFVRDYFVEALEYRLGQADPGWTTPWAVFLVHFYPGTCLINKVFKGRTPQGLYKWLVGGVGREGQIFERRWRWGNVTGNNL